MRLTNIRLMCAIMGQIIRFNLIPVNVYHNGTGPRF